METRHSKNAYIYLLLVVGLIIIIVVVLHVYSIANIESACLQQMKESVNKLPDKLVYSFYPIKNKNVTVIPIAPLEIIQEKVAGKIWKEYFNGEPKWTVGFYRNKYPDIFIAGDAFLELYKITETPIRYKVCLVLKNAINVVMLGEDMSDPTVTWNDIVIEDIVRNYTYKIDTRTAKIIIAKKVTVCNVVEINESSWEYKSGDRYYGTWIYQKPCDNAVLFQPLMYCKTDGDFEWGIIHYIKGNKGYPVFLYSDYWINKTEIEAMFNSDFLKNIASFSIKKGGKEDNKIAYYVLYKDIKYYIKPDGAPYLLIYNNDGVLKSIIPYNIYYGEVRSRASDNPSIPQIEAFYLIPPSIQDKFYIVLIKPFGVSELLAGIELVD